MYVGGHHTSNLVNSPFKTHSSSYFRGFIGLAFFTELFVMLLRDVTIATLSYFNKLSLIIVMLRVKSPF